MIRIMYFLLTVFSYFSFQNAFASKLISVDEVEKKTETLTLVVGNCRHPGGLKPAVGEIVEQEKGDFTHESSFGSNVLSVDICPLRGSLKTYPHLTIDFAGTSSDTILSRLGDVKPNRIFFEWFPSCVTGTLDQNATPLLLPALTNAFQIMAGDGELIIDHFPYAFSLMTDPLGALKKLSDCNKILSERVSRTLMKHGFSKREGVVSALLQKNDPFTLHICQGEHEELRSCLMFRIKNAGSTFDDSKCKFIKGKTAIINGLISQFSESLPMDETELMIRISNGILYSYQGTKEDEQGYWDLFEQHYYMKTRTSLITSKMQEIGFSDVQINYHEVNPYNKRKHAWLITARKKF